MSKTVTDVVQHAPAGVVIAWLAGLHLDLWLTILSTVWLLWLYADKINEKFIKPWRAQRAKPPA